MKVVLSKSLLLVFCAMLFMSCGKKPGSVIKDFYATNDWNEKMKCVFDNSGLSDALLNGYYGSITNVE